MMADPMILLYAVVDATYSTPTKATGMAGTMMDRTGTFKRGLTCARCLANGTASSQASDQRRRLLDCKHALPATTKARMVRTKRTVAAASLRVAWAMIVRKGTLIVRSFESGEPLTMMQGLPPDPGWCTVEQERLQKQWRI